MEKRTDGWLREVEVKRNTDLIFVMCQALYKGLQIDRHSCPYGAYAKL